MQTIYIDISRKTVLPVISAKQGDVGRKFKVILTDSGRSYEFQTGSLLSVFYSGNSGSGNYTHIGNESAFSISGNAVVVEMITQMLSNVGDGMICLMLSDSSGKQIGTWNIPYSVDPLPGAESKEAETYYTAFSKSVSDLAEYYGAYHPSLMDVGGAPRGKELTESWESLRTRIVAGNLDRIHIGDWKQITLTTGEKVVMEVAGIDQYFRCGTTPNGHHVDFISRDCLQGHKQFNATGTNNGTESESTPWRASALFTTLNETVFDTLPSDLKPYILAKKASVETRYSASGALTKSSGLVWSSLGKLWLPTEVEVFGTTHWSQPGFGSGGSGCNKQYPIFMGNARHLIKRNGSEGHANWNEGQVSWWLCSAVSGNAAKICTVGSAGTANPLSASGAVCVPLCFRIG